jgi:Short C-terminal domain
VARRAIATPLARIAALKLPRIIPLSIGDETTRGLSRPERLPYPPARRALQPLLHMRPRDPHRAHGAGYGLCGPEAVQHAVEQLKQKLRFSPIPRSRSCADRRHCDREVRDALKTETLVTQRVAHNPSPRSERVAMLCPGPVRLGTFLRASCPTPQTHYLFERPAGAMLEASRLLSAPYPMRYVAAVTVVELRCVECETLVSLPEDEGAFKCSGCRSGLYRFLECRHCGAVEQAGPNVANGGRWMCRLCWRPNIFNRRGPVFTAHRRVIDLNARGIDPSNPDARIVGGFTHVGGAGFDVTAGAVCSVATLPDATLVEVKIGKGTEVRIPYDDLIAVDLSGGATTTRGGFWGGGSGTGAIEGMLVASALNAASSRTTINTGFHIGSARGELLLHHAALTPAVIRRKLSPLFARYEMVRHRRPAAESPAGDPLAQLERLVKLRDAGALTEEEFQAARAEHVRKLTGMG